MKNSPISKVILIANILMFFLTSLFGLGSIGTELALFPTQNQNFEYWQFITHMFLHSGILHIGFNMLMFISFAPYCENILGNRQFLIFYLLSGVFAALTHLSFTNTPDIPIIGASGAVWSVFVFFSLLRPFEKVYLFFIPIGFKISNLIKALIAFEIFMALFSKGDGIGHFAHHGGAFFGWISYLYLKNGRSFNILNWQWR